MSPARLRTDDSNVRATYSTESASLYLDELEGQVKELGRVRLNRHCREA